MLGFRRVITVCKMSLHAAALGALVAAGVTSAAISGDERFLGRVLSLEISGASEFIASQKFSVGAVIGDRRIATIGTNFATHFGNLVERRVPPASLIVSELRYAMADTTIMRMVGGSRAVATHLSHIYGVIARGASGANHTDWQSNISFLRSPVDGELWAIHWSIDHSGNWSIGAVTVPHPALDWAAGTHIFSVAPKPGSVSLAQTHAGSGD